MRHKKGGDVMVMSTDLENIVNSLLAAGSALVERGGNNLKFKVRTWEGVKLGTRLIKRGM